MRRDSREDMLCLRVGLVVQVGVALSFVTLLAGLISLLVSSPGGRMVPGDPLAQFPGVPLVFSNVGVLILVLTPVAVLVAAARWFWPAEKRWALLCLAILGLFVVSFLLARS